MYSLVCIYIHTCVCALLYIIVDSLYLVHTFHGKSWDSPNVKLLLLSIKTWLWFDHKNFRFLLGRLRFIAGYYERVFAGLAPKARSKKQICVRIPTFSGYGVTGYTYDYRIINFYLIKIKDTIGMCWYIYILILWLYSYIILQAESCNSCNLGTD